MMKVKTQRKAGALSLNHNQTLGVTERGPLLAHVPERNASA
jgi:hypothetical protein